MKELVTQDAFFKSCHFHATTLMKDLDALQSQIGGMQTLNPTTRAVVFGQVLRAVAMGGYIAASQMTSGKYDYAEVIKLREPDLFEWAERSKVGFEFKADRGRN